MKIKGTINKLGRTGTYGWIDRKTVIQLDGDPYSVDGGKDIYVHQDDCEAKLAVGADVTFSLAHDESKRSSRYRACDVEQFVPQKNLELHIDATAIDNPSVPLRWCFTPEMHQRMIEGVKQGYTYSMLLIIKNQDDGHGFREQREIKSATQPFSYITFPKAGKWDVGMVLYENTAFAPGRNNEADLVRALSKKFLEKDRHSNHSRYERYFPSLQLGGLKAEHVLAKWREGYARPVAASAVVVEIPAGIFAPEPSPAAKAFANRFFRTKPYDECDHRRRMMIMTLGFGWVPWLAVEVSGRLIHLAFAFFQLLFALRGSSNNLTWSFKPATRFVWRLDLPKWGDDGEDFGQACYRPWDSKVGFFLTPGFLIVWGIVAMIVFAVVRGIIWSIGWAYGEGYSWPALGGLAVGLAYLGITKFLKRPRVVDQETLAAREEEAEKQAAVLSERRRQLALLAAGRRAENLERIAPALICGGDTVHEVSLKAIPTELKTFRMLFDHFKRNVCRPFG